MQEISGPLRRKLAVGAALTTPFDAHGEVLWPLLAGHADRLRKTGVTIVSVFGTTGEGASIDRRTRAAALEQFAGHGIAPADVAPCIYGPAARDAADDVRRSIAGGCGAMLLVPPFYYKGVSDEGLYRWHAEVFESAGPGVRDVILYNIPALTGATIGPALLGRLRNAFPGIVAGVKDSSGDWQHTTALLAEHRDLAVLVGHEGHLARAVQRRASGAISGVANIAPHLVASLASGREDRLIDWVLERLLRLPVVPALKAILAAQRSDPVWTAVRAPLDPIANPAQSNIYREIAERLAAYENTAS